MQEKEGLSNEELALRLSSGNYIMKDDKLVSVGASTIYDIVESVGLNYVLDIWFKCWRAQRYGLPGSNIADHAFCHNYHAQIYDEDDPAFIKKIQTNKRFYYKWISLCKFKKINPNIFEWLFVGTPRTPEEILKRIGDNDRLKTTIVNGLRIFQEVCGGYNG